MTYPANWRLMATAVVAGVAFAAAFALPNAALAKAKARPKPKPVAAAPAYVGVWAEYAGQCRKPRDGSDSAVRFTLRGYDQFEQHCDLRNIAKVGATFTGLARCRAVGAPTFNDAFTIWTSPGRLTIKWRTETTRLNYLRCR